MGIIYERAKVEFNSYYESVRNATRDLTSLTPLQRSIINPNFKKTEEELLNDFIISVNKLNQGKNEHTFRGVSDISGLFSHFELTEDYKEFAMIAELFHDVARFIQGFETGTHVDDDSYNVDKIYARGVEYNIASLGITNHGAHGEYLLRDNNTLEKIGLSSEAWDVIYNAVKYHAIDYGRPFPIVRMDNNLFSGKTTYEALKDPKYRIILMTLIFQAVKSVDDYDLHNKVLTGEIPVVRNSFGLDVEEGDTISDFARIWKISESALREHNNYSSNHQIKKGDIIRINSELVPSECFNVASDFSEMYYNDSFKDTDLPMLQRRKDYSFIYAQIFRLSKIRNIVFTPLLEHAIATNLFDRTLELYPPKYRLIIEPFITHAKRETEARIIDANGEPYAKRMIKAA